MVTYKNFIGGNWVVSSSKKTFRSYNPSNPKKVIGVFQSGNINDINAAVKAAEKALPAWSAIPAPERAKFLFKVAELLRKEKSRLGKLLSTEMGKVLPEALGDVQEAIDCFEYMAGEGRRLHGHTTPSELPNKWCMTVRMPLGVVGLITPWNFPIAIPSWKIAPALICGNTIVIKPSSDTPLCCLELVKIIDKAGIPKGVLNFVTGSGKDAGMPLVQHPNVRGISFTGSRATGEYITQHAGLKKIGLELGGKNAIIVMDDADLNLAVEGIIWGAFGTTGQRCTACSRVIVHIKVQKQLEKKLLARIKKLKLGDPTKKSTDVGPLINAAAAEKSKKYIGVGKKDGAKLLCGGKHGKGTGHFFEPTLFTNVKPHMRIAQEEIFGPVLSLIPVKNFDEAIKVSNGIDYGLSSAIYTADVSMAFKAMEKLETGLIYINSSTIGAEVHLPFGGIKDTGNGTREAGIEGIHEFSETKVIYVDYSGGLQKAQIDNS
jgi:alpha-ketoglutaric semialdehyde dehydrogenase